MKNLLFILAAFIMSATFTSCDKSQANVTTLISDDCGVHWKEVPAGQTIPSRVTACELKTTLPNSPMSGESHFKTTFANDVKAKIDLDYEYIITDAIKFIDGAKYLAKSNSDGDEVSANSGRFESAENSIIDKRIKEFAREMLQDMDIVEFDQSEFEDKLLDAVNKSLEPRGIHLNYLSFVPEPSIQTAQAIDVAQAMKIYESKGLGEAGKIIIANKAGASQITVNQPAPSATKQDE